MTSNSGHGATSVDDVLDLNPTSFVDDVYNAVELHCAAGFEELDQALRAGMGKDLSPEQLTALLQGTAGIYQDLRMEIKKRMRVFEEYALAEILRLPPGLLADPSSLSTPDADTLGNVNVTDEEEQKIDEEMKALQLDIAERKQRGRDVRATMQYLEILVKDVKDKMAALESVPNVLGSTKALEKDVEYVVGKGGEVARSMGKLDELAKDQGRAMGAEDKDVDREMLEMLGGGAEEGGEGATAAGDRVAMKGRGVAADVQDLRAFRESLLSKKDAMGK